MAGLKHQKLRREIIEACLSMNRLGINQGTSGNISVRVPEGFLITPSGIPYEAMTPGQIVAMDLEAGYEGKWLPSSEWRMHHDIYKARPEAMAVVHTHAPHATALSCQRRDLPAFHYMIAVAGGDSLRCADYATFGTAALSERMLAAMVDRRACLLANHGMICFAESLPKALWLAGEIETLCRQYLLACQTGQAVLLEPEEMQRVLQRFKSYGKQPEELAPDQAAFELPQRRER